ncbi:hypothetical protein C4580_03430 [Candidatus Woesearchaeota archaeon]|nr:MAG: hypothetical protein C4580_03430 [Candidatus Woesearchaeota archaeon]
MKLYEFEGKELLAKAGFAVPKAVLLENVQDAPFLPCVVKAQVLFGKRMKQGLVKVCKTQDEFSDAMTVLGKDVNGEKVEHLLVEELVNIKKEYYVSFCYDTETRGAVLLFSEEGGIDVEEIGTVKKVPLSELHLLKTEVNVLAQIKRLADVFVKSDCRLLEINPLAVDGTGTMIAVGAMVELDDAAQGRQKWQYPPRFAIRSERELEVKKANDVDHHGTVKYVELDGDIGVLAAGGGASLTCMDALVAAGGRPANFSEFSGNPTAEKVYTLARAVMTKPGVGGLWIVGAVANFSRVDVMMEGIIRALKEVNPKFPVVVRRAGPYEAEGLQMLRDAAKENGWDVEVHGSETGLTATAKVIVEKVKKWQS